MHGIRKVVCAPNALKGTLSATEAARAIALGARLAAPRATVLELPIADGGDGTREILVAALGGEERAVASTDPLGRPVATAYGAIDGGKTAIVDVASASGLVLLSEAERDPRRASSWGTGLLIQSALGAGASQVILGVGGSATVDGGAGLLSTLGVRFSNALGAPIGPGGSGLSELAEIDLSGLCALARAATFTVLCDVSNPLLGPDGAARAFAPQKGANGETVLELEKALENFAGVLELATGRNARQVARGGAAGGIAAGLWAVLNAELVSGIDWVLDRIGFDDRVRDADLVLTAEGRLDAGSLRNKGPVGVARRALRLGLPTLALVGSRATQMESESTPFAGVLIFGNEPYDEAEARREAGAQLTRAAQAAVARFAAGAG